jgi:hypothetical protein
MKDRQTLSRLRIFLCPRCTKRTQIMTRGVNVRFDDAAESPNEIAD